MKSRTFYTLVLPPPSKAQRKEPCSVKITGWLLRYKTQSGAIRSNVTLRHICSIWAISLKWEWLSSLCYPVNKLLTLTYPTLSCLQPVPVKRNYSGTSWISPLHSSVSLFTWLNRRAMMPSLTHIFPWGALEQISKNKISQWTGHFHYTVYHLSNLWSPSRDVFFEPKIRIF